jgi:hypothetical protein
MHSLIPDTCYLPSRSHRHWLDHSGNNTNILRQTNQPPWPLVRKRTIPTERPPLIDEI